MASKGYLQALLNKLPAEERTPIMQAFEHTLDTFRLGGNQKCLNFAWYSYSSTTAAVASQEFSVEHGQGLVPTKLIPYLDLSQVGSQVVDLVNSRAPDTRRVYLKSPSTGVVFSFLLEF